MIPATALTARKHEEITMPTTNTDRRSRRLLLGLLAAIVLLGACAAVAVPASASYSSDCPAEPTETFGICHFDGEVSKADGNAYTRAAGTPYSASTQLFFSTAHTNPGEPADGTWPAEPIKDIYVDVPAGLIGSPTSVAECTLDQLAAGANAACPSGAQAGTVTVNWSVCVGPGFCLPNAEDFLPVTIGLPVYRMHAPPDVAARFAFNASGAIVTLDAEVRSGSDYGVTIASRNAPESLPTVGTKVTLWGVPADPAHDPERACPGDDPITVGGLIATDPACEQPYVRPALGSFLRLPTSCAGPQTTTARVASWFDPADFKSASFVSHLSAGEGGTPVGVSDCGSVPFNPQVSVTPTTTRADSATGLDVSISLPQSSDPSTLGSSDLKDAVVSLPEGFRVNPSSADGLAACSLGQVDLDGQNTPAGCPDASKVGNVSIDTPLLNDPLSGSVYLATPNDPGSAGQENPFDSLVAIYLVAEGPGTVIKLPGKVDLDPSTGRVRATFSNQPQLPFNTVTVSLFDGPRSPISTPESCGTSAASVELTPWARPSSPVTRTPSVSIDSNRDGTACAPAGFAPGFDAGVVDPVGGAFSPFAAQITRGGGKELGRVDMTLPKGVVADLSDVDVCSDSALAAAAGKTGRSTQGSAGCPSGSQVGTTTVGVGSGDLFYPLIPGLGASGRVFLTGSHPGTQFPVAGGSQAAYGLAFEVPAVAGPFDLGTVLVRAAIYVDPVTAQLRVVSDRLPRILDGIPLDVRDVRVNVDRSSFTRTPTSCNAMDVKANLYAQDETAVQRSQRFQVGRCARLAIKPKLAMRLIGAKQTKTGGHPGLRTTLTQPAGQANIRRVQVKLPRSVALDPKNANNAGLLCPYEAGLKADCPASSVIGQATAVSPLLKRPLKGQVHFVQGIRFDRKTGNRIRTLPTLLVKLRGEVALDVRATSNAVKGQLVTTFPIVPDAQVSSFRLNLKGGKRKGILTATGRPRLCQRSPKAGLTINAHNGKQSRQTIKIKTPCT